MDKEALLTHILKSKGESSTLLGGQQTIDVINDSKYVNPVTSAAQLTGNNVGELCPSVDESIHAALSDGEKTVLLVGPEGSGKTTTLRKLIVDWTKGEQLQHISHVFHFKCMDLNSPDRKLSLEKLLLHHGHFPPESIPSVLQNPETLLFVFDDLDQYRHSLDPSDGPLCSDPGQVAPVSCLVASLLHGSLLKGAAILVASRPTECLTLLSGTRVDLLGFLQPQRKAYFNTFFPEPTSAYRALTNMEKTLGFYDFAVSPRFCWTVCSVYKHLMDAGEQLPETFTQLCVSVLVHIIQTHSLDQEASVIELVTSLGRMASRCCLEHSNCTNEEIELFLTSPKLMSVFLRVDGDLESDGRVFTFHSQVMKEFLLAVSFFMDMSVSEGTSAMLEKHRGHVKLLDLFLAGLSEPVQRRPLESLLGGFNSDRIADFKCWLKSSTQKTLEECHKAKHFHCFGLLHQCQNESLVKDVVTHSARLDTWYGGLSLQDCVALSYVVMCLGAMERLNLLHTKDLTEEEAEVLAPAMSLSRNVILSDCFLSTGAVTHLASSLNKGRTDELNLISSRLGDEKFKILCSGLRDCKLRKLNLSMCRLTEASCEDLLSVLTSGSSQLCVLNMMCNEIGDRGFMKLCQGLQSPRCKLQELQLNTCQLTAASMEALSAVLRCGQSDLRKVDLTNNTIGDGGVEILSKSLLLCKVQKLKLYDCQLTGDCCAPLMNVLKSEHCSLLELDLSVNYLGQEGALLLCQGLSRPGCPLERLSLLRCDLTVLVFETLGELLKGGTCRLKALSVGLNSVGDKGLKYIWDAISHPCCLLEELDVEMTELTDACVPDLCAAARARKSLKILNLKNNSLTNDSVPALIQIVQDNHNIRELNLQYNQIYGEASNMIFDYDQIMY